MTEVRILQSRKGSVVETIVSTAIGYVIAYLATWAILPRFGYPVTHGDNALITGFFTLISVIRGYCVRRLFNWWHGRTSERPRNKAR